MREINRTILDGLYKQARLSDRHRSHLLLHSGHNDKVQRLLIAFLRNSYVEPHFHELDHQWEMFVVLEGQVKICLYAKNGEVERTFLAGGGADTSIVEFHPGDIHSVECISDEALMLEIKEGPFDPTYAKSFPQW
ncbi:WbuC family cupin fold metalloprotein [Citrobacter portucalensis]|uniref:WbuC family cupin fold metalloprotein n=1 Tax=Citrobacter portucalensis TaxID=1639133 RepID=UPI00388EA637